MFKVLVDPMSLQSSPAQPGWELLAGSQELWDYRAVSRHALQQATRC